MSHRLYEHSNSTFSRVLIADVLCIMMVLVLSAYPVRTLADHSPRERASPAVIAAYILNISKLVEWPESDSTQLKICLLGNDRALAQELAQYKNTVVRGKTVTTAWYFDQSEAIVCQVLFVGLSERRVIESVIDSMHHRPVLLISEIQHFLDFRGMIELQVEDQKLGFVANPQCAVNAGLKIHSGLLALAKNYKHMKEIDCP